MKSTLLTCPSSRSWTLTPGVAETLLTIILAGSAGLIPFLFSGSQFLAGTLVNCILVLAALNLRSWARLLPVILVPSLAVLTAGMLFGELTLGLLLLLPVIWSGNAALAWSFRRVRLQRTECGTALMSAAAAKTLVILLGSAALVAAGLLPALFLEVIAPVQFLTAISGGLLAVPVHHGVRHLLN